MKVGTYDTWDKAIAAIDNHWYAEDILGGEKEDAEIFDYVDVSDNYGSNSKKSRWDRSSLIGTSIILFISPILTLTGLVSVTGIVPTAFIALILVISGLRFLYKKKPEYTLYKVGSYTSPVKYRYHCPNKFPIRGSRIDYYIQSNTFSGTVNHKVRSYVAPGMEYLRGLILDD